jgi:hypothetical protein
MDSILVVTYSYTGTSRRVAQLLASQHGWPLGEIKEVQPRSGGAGYFRCLMDSLLRRRPPVRYDGPDPGDFRTVVLVSPIWAWRLAGPMRSFIAGHARQLRRVAMVSTMGSSGAPNAEAEVTQLLGHAPVVATAVTARDLVDRSLVGRITGFGDEIVPPSALARAGREQPT